MRTALKMAERELLWAGRGFVNDGMSFDKAEVSLTDRVRMLQD